jgi:hypothetical protein
MYTNSLIVIPLQVYTSRVVGQVPVKLKVHPLLACLDRSLRRGCRLLKQLLLLASNQPVIQVAERDGEI